MIPLRDANPTQRTPVVTLALVAACAVVFALQLGQMASGGEVALERFFTRWGIVPAELVAALRSGAVISMDPRRSHHHSFRQPRAHGGNMLFLWIFGNIEDRFGRTVPPVLPGRRCLAGPPGGDRPDSTIPTIGVGRHRRHPRRLPRAVPRARVTTAISWSSSTTLDVPAFFGSRSGSSSTPGRPRIAWGERLDVGRGHRVLRAHRRVRVRGGGRAAGPAAEWGRGSARTHRGIIARWTTGWSRWSSRASGSICSPAATS